MQPCGFTGLWGGFFLNFLPGCPNRIRHTGSWFLPHSPGESTETGEDSRGDNMVLNPLGGPLSDCSLGGRRE